MPTEPRPTEPRATTRPTEQRPIAPRAAEPVVRAVVGAVLGASAAEWPRDRPLDELPDAIYDSLAQLEVLTRVERALGLPPRPVEPDRLRTIHAIVALVTEPVDGPATARAPAEARTAAEGGAR
ncbi:acyl carrier protein [Streptomyces mobaraensis]|uniref:acyl carrier protein n=1 Tax=Streptomyces mobaraensis TaxID=35621 RepID=UPI0013E0B379|nr:acyl carrier protein [Streptomyces mobaraensis]